MSRALHPFVPFLMSTHFWRLFILLVAAILRLYGLNNVSPPGLEHDEIANWLIDRAILEGRHAIYFTDAYGHEAGFHYLQAASIALLGDHALALRLPAAFSGLLLVAVSFALARRLFGEDVAIISAALLATLFWPVFYSRLGLRAISLPLVSALSAYFWWHGWRRWQRGQRVGPDTPPEVVPSSLWHRFLRTRSFLLAGLFAGLTAHTYMAARVVPIFYLLLLPYLVAFHRQFLKDQWRDILSFWIVYLIVAAPLIIYLQTNPGSEFRISEIDGPLRAMFAGDLRPVLSNSVKIFGLFGFAGDPLWRQNVARFPVYEPILATFFYLSLPLCFVNTRDIRYAFLALWLITATIPSLVTIDAPSTIRISNILPVLTIFPALLINRLGELSTVIGRLSTVITRFRMRLGLLILILYTIGLTAWALFYIWPMNDEVRFVWQAALNQAASFLDKSSDAGPVAIGGWTPDTMDPPTMMLSLTRDDLSLSFFNPTSSLAIPSAEVHQSIRIVRPTILPLDPLFVRLLSQWGATEEVRDGFVLTEMPAQPPIQPQFPAATLFNDELRFLGYDVVDLQTSLLEIITYWQVMQPAAGPRRLFVHMVDDAGNLLLEDYALDKADARFQQHWQAGDTLLQHHSLDLEAAGPSAKTGRHLLRLGFFDPNSCPPLPCNNLLTPGGAAYVELRVDK